MIAVAANPVEKTFSDHELIVSKTDLKGKITYANRTFMKICNMSEKQLLGEPHNIIRHPDMPRGVFYAMWRALKSHQEFFGFVKNITADGNFYWVFANITPDYVDDKMVGFYSVRRQAPKVAIKQLEQIYAQMIQLEKGKAENEAPKASWDWLTQQIKSQHQMSYEEFVLNLYQNNVGK